MVKKIEKLTDEQSAQMEGWAEKWIKIGLETSPADRDMFESACRRCYDAASIPWHGNVVWVDSPLTLSMSASLANNLLESILSAPTQSGERDEKALPEAFDEFITPIISRMVEPQIAQSIRNAAVQAMKMVDAPRTVIYSAVKRAAENPRRLFSDWHRYIGGQFWVGGYGWGPAFLSFFRECCDLELEGDLWDRSIAYEQTCQSACWWWPHTMFVIVSDRPNQIHLEKVDAFGNHTHRLHCETGPAISWPDGWGIYSWHGVTVPKSWIENRDSLDPQEVIQVENVEQRAAGVEIIGLNKMLDVLQCKVIDDSGSEDIGQLIELSLPGLDRPGRFLKARCPRNGTIVEGVPYVSDIDDLPINTALAAQAWRIGDPQSEYQHPPKRT